VRESIISLPPPPLTRIAHTIALLLHDYYAVYDLTPTPRPTPLWVFHTPYNIDHNNIVYRPSRKAAIYRDR